MLGSSLCCDGVLVPCDVIDKHLKEANEAQLKIYLYLLRNRTDGMISVTDIADYFNYTIQDVERCLKFWGMRGDIESEGAGDNIVNLKRKPSYTAKQLREFAGQPQIQELLFVTEQYVGKSMGGSMNPDLIATILYMYDSLHFNQDLIICLFEYCVEHKKNKLYQIEAIANEWSEAGIKNSEDAANYTREIPKEIYGVFKAFGLKTSGREPVDKEIAYVRKWTTEYGYGMDIISEACERTIMRIHDPSFSYANTILFGWHEAGVKTKEDIAAVDEAFNRSKEQAEDDKKAKKADSSKKSSKSGQGKVTQPDKFHNFDQRSINFAELEKGVKWQ